MLAECRRVLAPGGRLFVTVPAYRALWSGADDFAQHHQRYRRSGLEALLRRAGFQIDLTAGFFQTLILPIALFRALPYRLSLGSGSKQRHTPGGWSQRLVEWLLARELAAMRAGSSPRIGASIMAVAHAPSILGE